jgi:hypothetical protein
MVPPATAASVALTSWRAASRERNETLTWQRRSTGRHLAVTGRRDLGRRTVAEARAGMGEPHPAHRPILAPSGVEITAHAGGGVPADVDGVCAHATGLPSCATAPATGGRAAGAGTPTTPVASTAARADAHRRNAGDGRGAHRAREGADAAQVPVAAAGAKPSRRAATAGRATAALFAVTHDPQHP